MSSRGKRVLLWIAGQWVFPKTVTFRNGPTCKFGPKGKTILRIGPRLRCGGWNEIEIALDFSS